MPVMFLTNCLFKKWTSDINLCFFLFRVESDVCFVGVCGDAGFIDPTRVNPTLIDRPGVTSQVLFRHMLYDVIFYDESRLNQTNSPEDLSALRMAVRLACILCPLETSKIFYAELCLKDEQEVDDAHQLLLVSCYQNV